MENKSENSQNGKSNGQSNGNISKEQWQKIKDEFLKSEGTITEFCTNKELVYSTVYKHSSKENWIKQREDLKLEALKSGKVPFDEKVDKSMDAALEIIQGSLELGIIKAKDLATAVNTVERIQAVKYRMLDVPAPKQRIENTPDDKSPSEELEERVREQVNQIKTNKPGE